MTASAEPTGLDGREPIWIGQPRQEVVLTCPAFETGMGGGKGSGKTDVVVNAARDQIRYAHRRYVETGRKQRGRFIIFRKQLKNLSDITQRTMELYPVLDPEMGLGGWTKMEKRWTFTSGFVVELAHLEGPDDHLGYQGQELTGLGFDQLEEIPEDVYNYLVMQVRSKDDGMKKLLRVVATMNPGGKYGAWVKKYFVDECKPHNQIRREIVPTSRGPRETTRAFIPAYLADNKYLADDGIYEANLMRLPEHLRKMYLEGDWNYVPGAFFSSIFSQKVHVIKSFPIPGSWPVKGSTDWGSSAIASTHWGTRDPDGNVYFIDELYTPGITGRTYGEKMAKKFQTQRWSAEKKYTLDEVYFLIDRQARNQMGGDGRWSNAAAGIESWGIRLFNANKDRAGRAEQWMERLIPNRITGKPSVYIFGDRCPNLARVIPQLPADPHNPDDVDPDAPDDHCYDSSGFLLMDWPLDTSAPKLTNGDKDVERWLELARKRKSDYVEDDGGIHAGYGD